MCKNKHTSIDLACILSPAFMILRYAAYEQIEE